MKTTILRILLASSLVATFACGGDDTDNPVDGNPGDGSGTDGNPPPPDFVQIEMLARPAINEALLFTNDFNAGYNAAAPSFAGVDPQTLGAVVGEAKTVLKALYLGVCLLNGTIPGLTPQTGLHPAGIECHAIGPAIWVENSLAGVTLTDASKTAAAAYADAVFGLFIPDVMRVDTAVTSNYETLCGAGATVGLCGGRFVRDDVIDTTYDFLVNGAATPKNQPFGQVSALVQDGVVFDNSAAGATGNVNSRVVGDATNTSQGHPAVSNGFPYSAAPF